MTSSGAEEVATNKKINVTFINPGSPPNKSSTGGFWGSVANFMTAAAEDLNMNLEVIYSDRNHLKMVDKLKEVVNRASPPDYVVVVNEKLAAETMVKEANKAGVKIFVMLNTFSDKQKQNVGAAREKFKNWIGSLIPDNHYAGYQIGKHLIKKSLNANLKADDDKLHILAVAGDHATPASVERINGLKKAISEHPEASLTHLFYGKWKKDRTKEIISRAISRSRFAKTSAIWAANDPMALGALEAVVNASKSPGKDIIIGGLNWDKPALNSIKKGEMQISMGGHFMTGGWSLVLLYDYHNKKDFASKTADLKYKIFDRIDNSNVDTFLTQFKDRNWSKIDFKKFSKVHNSEILDYEFNLSSVLNQFK